MESSAYTLKKVSTRDKLIDSAIKHLNSNGIDGFNVTELTKEAKVGYGTFYHYFKSTNEVLEVAMAVAMKNIVKDAQEFADQTDDKGYAIAKGQLNLYRTLISHPGTPWMMTQTTKFADMLIENVSNHAKSVIKDAVDSGTYSEDLYKIFWLRFHLKMWCIIGGINECFRIGNSEELERQILMLSVPQIGTLEQHNDCIERALKD
jgi:AcrR family transcriptional regulator|tara:strand:+ start:337 stop:951 length:615 start_codon:yes stop_codon:yes gene_type:complete